MLCHVSAAALDAKVRGRTHWLPNQVADVYVCVVERGRLPLWCPVEYPRTPQLCSIHGYLRHGSMDDGTKCGCVHPTWIGDPLLKPSPPRDYIPAIPGLLWKTVGACADCMVVCVQVNPECGASCCGHSQRAQDNRMTRRPPRSGNGTPNSLRVPRREHGDPIDSIDAIESLIQSVARGRYVGSMEATASI